MSASNNQSVTSAHIFAVGYFLLGGMFLINAHSLAETALVTGLEVVPVHGSRRQGEY
jgi:hypothetical protein